MSQLPGSIGLTGVKNARELGGIPAAGGKKVRHGLLLRTGALCDATEEDRRILAQDYRLAWVADFRTLKEANARPDPAFRGASFYHLLVLDENGGGMSRAARSVAEQGRSDFAALLVEMARAGTFSDKSYCELLFTAWGMEAYRAFLDLALKNDGEHALLFHCTAGKDRTGIGAALLLSALGADREAVMEDFLLTNQYLAHELALVEEYVRRSCPGEADALMPAIRATAGVDRRCLELMLEEIDQRFGSMDAFLSGPMGFNGRKLERLRAIYLE